LVPIRVMKVLLRIIVLLLLVPLTAAPVDARQQTRVLRTRDQDVQFQRARMAWNTGNSMLEAKTRVDRVLAELPDDVEALKLRSAVLLKMNRSVEALVDARRAAELAPDDGETHVLLCEAALAAGDSTTAVGALENGANTLLQDVEAYVRLSNCAMGLGRDTEARAVARIAMGMDGEDPRGHLQLARVLVHSGNHTSAVSLLQSVFDRRLVRRETIRADSLLAPLLDRIEDR